MSWTRVEKDMAARVVLEVCRPLKSKLRPRASGSIRSIAVCELDLVFPSESMESME